MLGALRFALFPVYDGDFERSSAIAVAHAREVWHRALQSEQTIQTTINGDPAEWNREIWAKWDRLWRYSHFQTVTDLQVRDANYYTPRPYQDQYSTGSREEGFVFTTIDRQVYNVVIYTAPRIVGSPCA